MEQALVFYEQLGFVTTYHDEGFAFVERDGVALHFNASDDEEPPHGSLPGWISVTDIEALYQEYLPTNALPARSAGPVAQPWGMKEFFICDPFRNLILFGEEIAEEEAGAEQAG
jgi:hypothetical protein